LRNRGLGEFHEVVTLDTPELGSRLAFFLDTHSNCTFQHLVLLFDVLCGPPATVAQCFARAGKPLTAPGSPLIDGAVYSLFPDGRSLKKQNLSPPNIKDADWYAVSSIAPNSSILERVLNKLIAGIDSPACPLDTDTTIDNILNNPKDPLKDPRNDVIVTLRSQLAGAQASRAHTFPDLTHLDVVDSPDVNFLAACWLSHTCLPASIAQVSASQTAPTNKNAVPMPRIVADNPHSVDRLTLRAPAGLELGMPFELTVNTGSGDLPEIQVVQSDETGKQESVPAAISRVKGQTAYLNVTPRLLGKTKFEVTAAYRDGGVATKEVAANVGLPSCQQVKEFHAHRAPVAGIRLDLVNPRIRLQPWVINPDFTGRVYLDMRSVSYRVAPSAGAPVVKLYPKGILRGLQKGTATVIGQCGLRSNKVLVEVGKETPYSRP
jgi:hypothetical protein